MSIIMTKKEARESSPFPQHYFDRHRDQLLSQLKTYLLKVRQDQEARSDVDEYTN